MRSLATLIAGGPARVAVTTVGIVATGFVASGYGDALLRGLFVTFVAASAGLLIALSLLFLAAAMGIDVEGAVAKPAPKEADHG
ncbi:hypothetical protein B2G69_08200 [Methylorubrum zatmanii]|nr:hypothetical protein [Methylorubrum zatmanii]ARO54130.1 hypothetical protein B2G69_08200 [Methylorubrum zatmanii]